MTCWEHRGNHKQSGTLPEEGGSHILAAGLILFAGQREGGKQTMTTTTKSTFGSTFLKMVGKFPIFFMF